MTMLKHCSSTSLDVQTYQASDSKACSVEKHMFGQKTVNEIHPVDCLGKTLSVSLMFIDQEESMITEQSFCLSNQRAHTNCPQCTIRVRETFKGLNEWPGV